MERVTYITTALRETLFYALWRLCAKLRTSFNIGLHLDYEGTCSVGARVAPLIKRAAFACSTVPMSCTTKVNLIQPVIAYRGESTPSLRRGRADMFADQRTQHKQTRRNDDDEPPRLENPNKCRNIMCCRGCLSAGLLLMNATTLRKRSLGCSKPTSSLVS